MQEVTNGEIWSFLKAQEVKTGEIASSLKEVVNRLGSVETEIKSNGVRLTSVEGRLGFVETVIKSLKVEVEKNTKNIHENGIIMEKMGSDIRLLSEGSNAHFVKIEKAIDSIIIHKNKLRKIR